MKKIFLLICTVICLPAFVPPPIAPMASLEVLPNELKQEILAINSHYGSALNIDALAKGILNLAATKRALREQINNLPNILAILRSLPKPAALYLVEKLAKLPVIQDNMLAILQVLPRSGAVSVSQRLAATPGVQRKEVKEWLKTIKLEHGKELFDAIDVQNPDSATIKKMLANPNIDLNWSDNIQTSIMKAVGRKHKEIVKDLLLAGADINIQDKDGWTALYIASYFKYPEIIELLLQAGANVNLKDNKGQTALMKAASIGSPEIVKLLIDAGAESILYDKANNSAFKLAQSEFYRTNDARYKEIITLLEQIGKPKAIKPPAQPASYLTQLPADIRHEILRYSLHGNEYMNVNALAKAITSMKESLTDDAIIGIFKSLPYTANALDLARALKDLPIMQNPAIKDWVAQATGSLIDGQALFDAVKAGNSNRITDLLKNRDINLNWQTHFYSGHDTPLIEAVNKNSKEMVDLLLKAGANTETSSRYGTALSIAVVMKPSRTPMAVEGYELTQQELVKRHEIFKKNNAEIVAMLLKAGANPNAQQGASDTTPLMRAVSVAAVNNVKMLLDAGANVDIHNTNRRTAIDYLIDAADNGYPLESRIEIEKLLKAARKV